MSTQTARGLAAGQTDEERIERYLSLNPDFFERHQPLLARMRLPHMRTGSTVSLVERQVEVLREQKSDADRPPRRVRRVARANDQLADKHPSLHAPHDARARRAVTALDALEASLREDFDAFHSVLVLTSPIELACAASSSNPSCASCRPTTPTSAPSKRCSHTGKPRCGQVRDTQRDFLFGPESASIGSVALVPLGDSGRRSACSRSAARSASASIRA